MVVEVTNWLFGKDGALFRAAATGELDLARELAEAGANINIRSSSGYTPLHRAAQHGHLEMVEFLLSNNADVAAKTLDDRTAVIMAEEAGHEPTAALLRKHM